MIPTPSTTDADIRAAFHRQRLRCQKRQTNTLVVDELGLAHARRRIDIAVINGHIHGYEIKSDQDNLNRLSSQITVYRKTLQRLTIVTVQKHLREVLEVAPEWCGVVVVMAGPRGGIKFSTLRSAKLNPDVEPVMVAHLLWKDEVTELLLALGYSQRELRQPRRHLYETLCEKLTIHELASAIRKFMLQRKAWRGRLALV